MDFDKELELINQIQQDLSHFTKLYDTYVKDVYRFVYSKVGNKTEAEDITSETFLKALENIKNYKIIPGKSIKAWFFAISKNIILGKYKKNMWTSIEHEVFDNTPIEDDNILDKICDQDILNRIIKYMNENLDKTVNDIIRLKIWDDLTFEEISDLMGIKLSTVKMKYYRAIQKLKEQFLNFK